VTLGLGLAAAASAQEPSSPPLPSWAALQLGSALAVAKGDGAREDGAGAIEAGKSYPIPALEIVGFDVLLNLYDRHHFACCDFDSNLHTVRDNLRSRWDVDRDPFTVNQLGHPYQGSMYHGFARASGLGYWEALAYTFAGSAFWEIAGESTPPSRNDQINTGIGGSFLGEALFRMSHLVLEGGGMSPFWNELVAAAISPPTGFSRLAFGNRFMTIFPSHDPAYFSRLQLGFSGTAHNESGASTARLSRDEALADFLLDYGLPGKRDYDYTRPFDYFSLQATASSANGFENVMTRGLLKGRVYEGGSYRGVWGLFGIYDYIAPQTYRVSSTGAALGTTGEWHVRDSMAVLGTALFGLGYTAAASTRSTSENDFHYGVAPQGLVALRAIYRNVCALDVAAREYYVSRVAAADRGGHENIVRVDAAFTYRLRGPHGISIKYLGNRRSAYYPDIGDVSQHRATVGIFYTLLGQDLFGATVR
jgi:Domain of unknown function (DUF3943)